jgi:NAD(P)-dependent dehydrogenase (short-subunit alcohol dehydrogenase family)
MTTTTRIENLFGLTGRVALVTGAGSGLGRAISEGYAAYGASVAVVDIEEASAKETVDAITHSKGKAIAIRCDVRNLEQVRSAVSKCTQELGPVNILVNNAGIVMRSRFEDMSDESWDTVMNINLRGPFLFCREVGRDMIQRGKGGRIINMASIAALVGLETGNANYSAAKGGMISLTRCMALEWAKHNILVNAIAPTHMRTKLIASIMKEKPETAAYFVGNIPLGRIGEPSEIVGPAVFLASEASSFVTGHTLVVDGGHTVK